jgi:hypothetical protein
VNLTRQKILMNLLFNLEKINFHKFYQKNNENIRGDKVVFKYTVLTSQGTRYFLLL